MDSLLLLGYEAAATLLPFLIAMAVLARRQPKRFSGAGIPLLVFGVYLTGVFYFTGAGTLYDLLMYSLDIRATQINLVPFSHTIDRTAYLLNVVLFFPLGILAPLIWNRLRRFGALLGASLGFSLLIELSQLLNNRSTDVDDLILNTLGGLIGFGCYKIWARCTGSRKSRQGLPMSSFLIGLAAAFIGRFLLYNEIGLVRLLYF